MKKLKVGKKSGLKYFSIADIRSWKPCYDPIKCIPEGWRGTAIDVLKREEVPFEDRLWVVLRPEIVSDRIVRLFAVWCARQALALVANPDPRSVQAVDAAEKYALGQATVRELATACTYATSAARSAAWSAKTPTTYATWVAAYSAAYSAAPSAAYSAFRSATYARWSAGIYASTSADTELVGWSPDVYADAAARAADVAADFYAYTTQRDKLLEMIITEGKECRK